MNQEPTYLRRALAQAKQHLRDANTTFTNVGRLHAFLRERGGAGDSLMNAPLAAMKFICRLEKIAGRAGEAPAVAGHVVDEPES